MGRGSLSSEGVSFCHCGKRLEIIDLKEERIPGLTIDSHLGAGVRQTGGCSPSGGQETKSNRKGLQLQISPQDDSPMITTSILKVSSSMAPQADGQDFSMGASGAHLLSEM